MFNAIANFIFGGISSDVQDGSSQFETTEVNDWLLVNIPNQPIDDIEIITDEDDFLEDIHHILPMEDSCDNSFSDVISPSVLFLQKPLDHNVATQTSFLIEECLQDFQTFPEFLKIEQSYIYPSEFALIASQYFDNPRLEELFNSNQSVVIVENKSRASTTKTVVVLSKDSKVRSVPDKRICHPAASSKNYVNHRSPVQTLKTALLEQIKELKPMQQAIEYDVKKHASKSQLCRQNKNYIFEGSTKSNRRNKLWRNHSGANNNRKCN